jgi:hypothetical protein
MSIAVTNVLSSTANAALNTYISPRYANLANDKRAPGQPVPAAFGIWFPIFAGQIAYGFLPEEERSAQSSLWNHAIQASGGTYAWTLVNEKFYSMQGAMGAMTFANYMYLRQLPKPSTAMGRAVGFAAELGLGWLVAADLIVSAQNGQRWLKRDFTHNEQDLVGASQALSLGAAAVAANRLKRWNGVSIAAAWALGGIALDKRSKKHVRVVAGLTAAGVLTDLALRVFSDRKDQEALAKMDFSHGEDAIETNEEIETDDDYVVLIEDTYLAPNIVIEEVTTVRI